MKMVRYLLALTVWLALLIPCSAQQKKDTLSPHRPVSPYKVDTFALHKHSPRKATLYSTFLPGLGQIYNKKYWKAPICWAAVGIPVYTYIYNRTWYRKCQYAISILDTYLAIGAPVPPDSLKLVDPKLQIFLVYQDDNSLRSYRNEFRKDEDYSVLFFLLFWGLNIVDATVDAHLMSFDISDQLTIHLDQPGGSGTAGESTGMKQGMGLSLVFDYHKPHSKTLAALP
jgi:hypothetical protein